MVMTRMGRSALHMSDLLFATEVRNLLNHKDCRGQVYDIGAYHNGMMPKTRNANTQCFAVLGHDGNVLNGDPILICTKYAVHSVEL
jgi:hypothetical protein